MTRDAHFQLHVFRTLDLDHLGDLLERLGPLGRDVAAAGIQLFEVEVLHVRAGVGEPPRDPVIAPQGDDGDARQRGPDEVPSRDMEVREIPDGGRRQPQVRVVGEQRLVAGAAAAGDHPVIRPGPFWKLGWSECEHLLHVRNREAQGFLFEAPVKGLQVREGHGRIPGKGGQELLEAGHRKCPGKAHAQQFRAPVAAQVPGHHLHPDERIDRGPGLGPGAGQQELDRQDRTGRQESVDPGRVGFEHAQGHRVQLRQAGLGRAAHADGAQEPVGLQAGGAEEFGQPPGADPAVHFHLPEPVLGMDIAQRVGRVRFGGGKDVGNAVGVAQDLHGGLQGRRRDFPLNLRQGVP